MRHAGRRRAAADPWDRILFVAPHQLLILFLVALVLPTGFSLAGLQLTAYNSILIVFIIPAFLYWLQHRPRVLTLDAFMLLYILWIAVAIYHNHGTARLVFILNQSVTLFGSYLLGRVLVRDPASYRLTFVCMFWILVGLLPLALIELLLKRSLIDMALGLPGAGGGGPGGIRLGMRRVSSVFPHPILFGVFCSIMVSNFFYVFYERVGLRTRRTLLAVAMTFMSLSSGPILSMFGQLVLIGWERLFRLFVTKWYVLAVASLTLLGVFQLGYPGGVFGFIIDHFAFNTQTGEGRLEILYYGSQTVAQNPLYGIGLDPWNGPWWRPVSVDNFWMVTAMRYGLPALGFVLAGLAWHAVRIMGRGGLSAVAASYRKGYVFAAAGTVCALAAVHVWGSVAVFVMFFIGAGAWFYDGTAALAPVAPPDRTRGQPRPLPAAPVPAAPVPAAPVPAAPAPPAGRRPRLPAVTPRRTAARQDLHR